MKPLPALDKIVARFHIDGSFTEGAPCGSGHINDTYCVTLDQRGRRARCVLQRINHHVFKDPPALMENIRRVTTHLAGKLAGTPGAARRVLTLIPSRDGAAFHRDDSGNFWRAYHFIDDARTIDTVENPRQAFEAARAFGRFQQLLADLPAPRLRDTIPDFHHTPRRFGALERAIAADAANRATLAAPEIEFALRHRALTTALLDANLPERVTHNDTKLNNVMFDHATGEGICVIDLDTVMPGLALHDFGDMVRSTTSPAAEDERDLSRVRMQFPMFEALVRGYLDCAGGFLTATERRLLPIAGQVITFETGIRFLADYLSGDTYFKIHREGHNLDRCRTQFRLVESLEKQQDEMQKLVEAM
jgi:hypothetical protein